MNDDQNANAVQTPVADPNAPVEPVVPTNEVPGEVSGEVPAGAPVEPAVEEEKSEEAPVAPAV